MGFVDFPNPNTNTSKIFYYTQSLMICLVEQKSHIKLSKMTKMNIVNPSAWGHLNPSSYCDVGRLF